MFVGLFELAGWRRSPAGWPGAYLWAVLGSSALVAAAGLFGGISGMR
jgi:hypothetical protein